VAIQFWLGLAAMEVLVLFVVLRVSVFFTLVEAVAVQTILAQKALAV